MRARPVSMAQRGASMIEVLVAILIVSMGILALAGLLGVSSRLGKTSEFRAVASLMASDLAERMRANRPGADLAAYDLAPTGLAEDEATEAACTATSNCTAAQLAAADVAEWQTVLFRNLPGGTGAVTYDLTSGAADVWVMWRDPKAVADSDNTLINASVANRCPPSVSETNAADMSCMYFRVGL